MKLRSTILLILMLCTINFSFSQTRNEHIGVCVHFDQGWSLDIFNEISELGCGWIRDGVNWSEVEKTKGVYNLPTKTLNWFTVAKQKKLKVLLVLAGPNPLYDNQYNPTAFANFATYLVKNYSNYFSAVEILNEPNNSGFSQYYEKGKATFNGIGANKGTQTWVIKYVNLLNTVANKVKTLNRNITVIGLGALPPTSVAQIKYGLSSNVDGITDHPYSENAFSVPFANNQIFKTRDVNVVGDSIGTYFSYIKSYKNLLAQYKKNKQEIWVTEFGYSTNPETSKEKELNQASSIAKRLIESQFVGVKKSFIYSFRDNCNDVQNKECGFGLRTTSGEKKVAFTVVQELCKDLSDYSLITDPKIVVNGDKTEDFKDNNRYRVYGFNKGKSRIYYIWSIGNNQIKSIKYLKINPLAESLKIEDLISKKIVLQKSVKSVGDIALNGEESANSASIFKITIN